MTGLINGILVLVIIIGVVGLAYLLILIFKLIRTGDKEDKKAVPNHLILNEIRPRVDIAVGNLEKMQEEFNSSINTDSSKTILLSAGTVGHAPYAKLRFILIAGQNSLREEFLIYDKTTIGRSSNDAIHIDDRLVSRHHADLILKNGKLYLIDQESANGTIVNGKKIPPLTAVFVPNDAYIKVGNSTFKVEELKILD